MDVKIRKLPKSKIEIKVKLSGEELSPYLTIGAEEISKDINIPGFRPGKTPQKIIEEKVGRERTLEKGAEVALNNIFSKIIKKKKLEILGRPSAKIQKISQEELEASIETVIFPKVELPSWKKIAKAEPRNKVEVKEEEGKKALKHLQKSRAKFIKKIGPAAKGDLIQIDYEIRSGGVKIENGDMKNQKLILGEGKLLPGFEEKLIGSNENEEREFFLNGPPNFWKKELRGKVLNFKVKMKGVLKVKLPKINDEWAHSIGNFNNLAHLRKSLLEGIRIEKEEAEKKRWENVVLEKISQETKIDLPDIMIEKERDQMIENFKVRTENMGLSFQDYLSHLKKSLKDLREDFLPEAERRTRILLSLYQLAREEKIDVSKQELKEEKNEILKRYPNIVGELRDKEKEEKFTAYMKENILQRKVIEFLFLEAGQK